MDTILANPQNLTPLALLGLVLVQVLQMMSGHLKAKSDAAARHDDSLAGILQRVLDQHTEAMGRQAGSLEKIAATMSEIQAHMHGTNAALNSLTHRLEAVERQLAGELPYPVAPVARGPQPAAVRGGSS